MSLPKTSSLTLGNLVTCTPSLTDDGRAGAAVGGTASSLWFERRRSGKGESVVARVSRMSAAIVVIAAKADMTVRIPCRGIKGLDLLPGDCRAIGGQAAAATLGSGLFAAKKRCPKLAPSV